MADIYHICIIGDNIHETTIELTDEEIEVFNRIISSMKADGPYAPMITVTNISLHERKAKELAQQKIEEERKHDEEFKEECSHLGKYSIASKYPNLATLFAEHCM